MTAELAGLRVLVVEDEFLVATLIEDMPTSAGCVVSGPIPRLAEALDAAHRGTFDAAVLDVNLAGDRIDPVADVLSGRNVPFVFVTGYTTGALPAVHAERPRLCKPFKMADLLDKIAGVVAPPSAAA
ncbi:MAG TPA: response regulator [Stellaceae bacterium]|jgi:DNA-binding response OmpR family regulator|nr:response regulator [Stellaceae bacterium]